MVVLTRSMLYQDLVNMGDSAKASDFKLYIDILKNNYAGNTNIDC